MAHTYKFGILKALPDPRKGERVNVGIVVFQPQGPDVRFTDLAKANALVSAPWPEYADAAKNLLVAEFKSARDPDEVRRTFDQGSSLFKCSDLSEFKAHDVDSYEGLVKEILDTLVAKPRKERGEKTTRVNTEMTAEFRRVKLLADRDEGIKSGKIVRNYAVSPEEGLTADFAFMNGRLHVTTTLDLRKAHINQYEPGFKAIVLDKAKRLHNKQITTFGVYAAHNITRELKPHVELLSDYADHSFNWLNRDQRKKYQQAIYSAIRSPGGFDLK